MNAPLLPSQLLTERPPQRLSQRRPLAEFSSKLDGMDASTQRHHDDAPRIGHDLAALARRYCELIDLSGGERQWLREVDGLLPRLREAATTLNGHAYEIARFDLMDLDARFEIYSHLRDLLADRDGYWLEYDSASDGDDAMTGSLADDLTDIYCDLKLGLLLYDLNPEDGIAAWSSGYRRHWRQHLQDAESHLGLLKAQSRLAR